MNPEMPAPQFRPEVSQPAGFGPASSERGPGQLAPERSGEQPYEYEQGMKSVDRSPVPQMPPPVLPAPMPQQVVAMPAAQPQTNNPALAADDDLIEQEWVDKAKKIIAQTADDPYRREQEVSRLQADYLQKRYGRQIGIST